MREEFERREQIKAGKRKESRDHIHISDEEGGTTLWPQEGWPMSKPMLTTTVATPLKEVGAALGRHRDDPDRLVENLGGYKIRIPPFHGNNNPDEYMDWEKKCEFNFNLHNISNINRVKLAVSEFNDYALRWWEQVVTAREIGGALEVSTWEEMTRIMRQRFIPSYYQRELHSKLRRLTQGSKTVEGILPGDGGMMLRANVIEDRSHYVQAVLAEQQLKRKTPSRFGADQRRPMYPRDSKPAFTPKSEPRGASYSQDKDKSKTSSTPGPRARELKCFKCQGFGHYAYECRNKKI
ncbi:unnamed protein product [Microthlaspi erraticum]|uniref:CCHC-type domain-containing protein n=1 Tax=Microthlaspi erraticum TaxID=1685480 RepID=A0A6D2ILY7_9BRAS|nr:unnamed protein product [Microthlaspi erraticum]